jgi:hypothetical protein
MRTDENIAWGEEANGLRLGISVNLVLHSAEERSIVLEIFVTNSSSNSVSLVESHVLAEYDFEVMSKDGKPVSMTREGDKVCRAARTLELSRTVKAVIDPGATHKVDWPVRLDEWFDLNEPGTYSVRVVRRDWQGSNGLLASGSQTFTVDDRTLKS